MVQRLVENKDMCYRVADVEVQAVGRPGSCGGRRTIKYTQGGEESGFVFVS